MPADFRKGLKFGAGFAVSWVLVVFVGIPLLFIGGCGLLIATAGHDSSTPATAPSSVPRSKLVLLERKAVRDVRATWPHYHPRHARCRFVRIDRAGPDSWEFSCTVTARSPSGKLRFLREPISCFDAPPYASTDSCDTTGVTPHLL